MLAQRVTFSWRVYIGAGEKTIYLYKVDADTHWDPLVDVAYDPPSIQSLPSALESAVIVVDSDSGAYSLSLLQCIHCVSQTQL